jgi:hypothetical protein
MLVVIMIETPTGTANAFDIASVPGVDVVIVGNNDLSLFSGFPKNDDRYQMLVTKIHDDTLRAGKTFGQANAMYAKGHPLSKDAELFENGPSNDGWKPPGANRTLCRPERKKAAAALAAAAGRRSSTEKPARDWQCRRALARPDPLPALP